VNDMAEQNEKQTEVAHGATQQSGRIHSGVAALWASAFVLMGLIIVSAGRFEGEALADVSEVGDLTVLTVATGDLNSEEVVAILSRRSETLFIYGVEQGRTVERYVLDDLSRSFGIAREKAGGGGR
jgi:hypothetical protein